MEATTFCEDCDALREALADGVESDLGHAMVFAKNPRSPAVVRTTRFT